jgi:hypothetical protein
LQTQPPEIFQIAESGNTPQQLICNQQVIGSNPIAGSSSPRADPPTIKYRQ